MRSAQESILLGILIFWRDQETVQMAAFNACLPHIDIHSKADQHKKVRCVCVCVLKTGMFYSSSFLIMASVALGWFFMCFNANNVKTDDCTPPPPLPPHLHPPSLSIPCMGNVQLKESLKIRQNCSF